MTQQFTTLAALSEDPGFGFQHPRWLAIARNSSSTGYHPLPTSAGTHTHLHIPRYTYTHNLKGILKTPIKL